MSNSPIDLKTLKRKRPTKNEFDIDFLTIGQYLQPSVKHAKLEKFITPEEFELYKTMAYAKGFLMVASSPLTRSSYHASEDFLIMKKSREKEFAN